MCTCIHRLSPPSLIYLLCISLYLFFSLWLSLALYMNVSIHIYKYMYTHVCIYMCTCVCIDCYWCQGRGQGCQGADRDPIQGRSPYAHPFLAQCLWCMGKDESSTDSPENEPRRQVSSNRTGSDGAVWPSQLASHGAIYSFGDLGGYVL